MSKVTHLIAYAQMPLIPAHADVFSEARGLFLAYIFRRACTFAGKPKKKYVWFTLNFYPSTLNFFLQILKLEENSRTK